MNLPRVLGIAAVLYAVAQLVFAQWFFERRRRKNERRSLWFIDVRGLDIRQARVFAMFTLIAGIAVFTASFRISR